MESLHTELVRRLDGQRPGWAAMGNGTAIEGSESGVNLNSLPAHIRPVLLGGGFTPQQPGSPHPSPWCAQTCLSIPTGLAQGPTLCSSLPWSTA